MDVGDRTIILAEVLAGENARQPADPDHAKPSCEPRRRTSCKRCATPVRGDAGIDAPLISSVARESCNARERRPLNVLLPPTSGNSRRGRRFGPQGPPRLAAPR